MQKTLLLITILLCKYTFAQISLTESEISSKHLTYIGQSKEDTEYTYYARKINKNIFVLIRTVALPNRLEMVTVRKELLQVDCDSKKTSAVYRIDYNHNGNILKFEDDLDSHYRYSFPNTDTPQDILLRYSCGEKFEFPLNKDMNEDLL